MKLEQSFVIDSPVDVVWNAFQNVETLVNAMPGAELIGAESNDNLKLRFSIKLGPIAAQFEGNGAVTHDAANKSGVFSGQAADRKSNSRVKGEAKFQLKQDDVKTHLTKVSVDVDYALTGTMAQFSRGAIVREVAQQLTDDFAANLERSVRASTSSVSGERTSVSNDSFATTSSESSSTTGGTHVSSAPAINGFSLLFRALVRWVKGMLGVSTRN